MFCVNSIRNKFDGLKFVIDNKIDIFLISENRLEDSFLTAQFLIEGSVTPYRHHRNSKGGGLLLYIRKDIPSKRLWRKTNYDIETLIVEINFKKRKWFLNEFYNSKKKQISHHLECLNCILNEYNSGCNNFNVNLNESSMKRFCNLNGLKSLINEPTCFKNAGKPTCTDLILTNRPTYFQLSTAPEAGLSDFNLLTIIKFKMGFKKSKTRVITYRDYKKFNKNAFRSQNRSLCSCEAD